jgi:transcriptional regulator with XRE-family HTH domain
MANSLSASEKGLRLVDDAREKLGWNRTDRRLLEAAEVSRATLNRFYKGESIKHGNFVAICKAVGIEKWQRVAIAVLPDEKKQMAQAVTEIPPTLLELFDRQLREWFKALRYEIEDGQKQTAEYFEWIVRIPVRSRFDRILIRGVTREPGLQDLGEVQAIVAQYMLDRGYQHLRPLDQ